MTATPGPDAEAPRGSRSLPAGVRTHRSFLIRRVLVLVLLVAIAWTLFNLVGQIDWGAVRDALGQLDLWELVVLLVVLVVRQVLDSVPLRLYTPEVTILRAMMNDLGAKLMVAVAPPPSDFALRISMFGSWGVPTPVGLAGTAMNMVTFYIIRFLTPLAGFVVLLGVEQPPGIRLLDLLWIAAGVLLFIAVLLVVRSVALARWVGSTAGRWVRKVRRQVDPDAWAESCVTFRRDIADRFYGAFPLALLSQAVMLAVELVLVVLCLRFVGVGSDQVGFWDVAVAFLFAYPMTILPFNGLGVVDALIAASLVQVAGHDVEAGVVAALILWRIFTLGGAYAMGAASILVWRHGVRTRAAT
ncbi:MAG: flippase-like domain-containing protein [Marmoricola sp.]|nr:flippase-like domain-containing protein [Marmoricola sp.]